MVNIAEIASEIKKDLKKGGKLAKERKKLIKAVNKDKKKGKKSREYIYTGIEGFDALLHQGIPKNASIVVAGGAGSGKTIMCLQIIKNAIDEGKRCYYMSFEESPKHLKEHMEDFGWDMKKIEKTKKFLVERKNPYEITRSVEAMLEEAKGDLLIKVDPFILPKSFKPDIVVIDSLTAIASAFVGKEDSYRIYIEQLFRFLEKMNATSFLISETEQVPKIFSTTGVEEFLADGVVVLYSLKRGNIRENAIEVLKLRGAKHEKKIVAMQITEQGVVIYPEQEVFGGIE